MPYVRLLSEGEVRSLISHQEALDAVRAAFVALHRGAVSLPEVLTLVVPERSGEVHAKGAYVSGSPYFTIKVASGFPANARFGVPDATGLSLVFDATTGFPAALLLDNGYLTQLRTGAAGALAADLLARPDASRVTVIGSGLQARFQLHFLTLVRRISSVKVSSLDPASASRYAREMSESHGFPVEVVDDPREAVADADMVVTVTPSREPIVELGWLRPGTHVTAVGADMPEKQELDPALVASADVIVADEVGQGVTQGELHHALAAGLIAIEQLQTIGGIAAGDHPGRTSEDHLTVADLTGVGIQDAAVAAVVVARAAERELGQLVDPTGRNVLQNPHA